MTNPPRAPPPNVTRKPLSPSPFNPPDLPPLSAHVASEAAMPSSAQAPPPTPPPKDRPPEAKAPLQTSQQGRPGTPDFFLQNSTYSMPGAYPTTPGANTDPRTYSPSPLAADPRSQTSDTEAPCAPQPVTPSPGRRRSSGNSIRTLLSSLRRPSNQSPRDPRTSSDSYGGSSTNRPDTPGRDSIASSTRPNLRKKMSGTFWGKRKSSLGMEIMIGKGDQISNDAVLQSPLTQENGHSLATEQRTSSPIPEDASDTGSILKSVRQRKSGTFWSRRKSSMGNELNAENLIQEKAQDVGITTTAAPDHNPPTQPPEPLRKKKSGTFWPRKLSLSLQRGTEASQLLGGAGESDAASPTSELRQSAVEEPEDTVKEEAYVHVNRPRSPPPKLPELNLQADEGHGSFMNGGTEDLFGRIGKDL